MKDVKYALWLQNAVGAGKVTKPLIDRFKTAQNIYNAGYDEIKKSKTLHFRTLDALKDRDLSRAEEIAQICAENSWKIITFEDEIYPESLKQIPDMPIALFCDGEMPDLNNMLSIGIVGSRNATQYALRAADYLAYSMSLCGAVVISGGAVGVDGASHRAALRSKSKTIAVLGNGLDDGYLKQNAVLRQSISKQGCLLSEYPPGTPALPGNFPLRNRLVAALSDGVIVVEAGQRSGSLITARRAGEYGKDVFAVPGSIVSRFYDGTNALIADGAAMAVSPSCVLEYYTEKYPYLDLSNCVTLEQWSESYNGREQANVPAQSQSNDKTEHERFYLNNLDDKKKDAENKSREEEKLPPIPAQVYACMTNEFEHIDLIIAKCNLSGSAVSSALTQLEISGLVQSASGKRYRKD